MEACNFPFGKQIFMALFLFKGKNMDTIKMIKKAYALLLCMVIFWPGSTAMAQNNRQIRDATDRIVTIPANVNHIICSGSGSLRLVTYLAAQDLVVGVDDIEKREQLFDARPYALANPQFKKLPIFGGFRGRDNPEKILGLDPLPQVIIKTYAAMGYDPVKLEEKTGIPVITLEYGDLFNNRKQFYTALTILGRALAREKRARAVIEFFDGQIADLERRTRDLGDEEKKTCFVGGVAFKGPHGFASTEPGYPPFYFVNARNIAMDSTGKRLRHTIFSKEKILQSNPQALFIDLYTLQMGEGQGGLYELKKDPVYQELTAVRNGHVFGLLPYNAYTQNFGSILANAWFIGKTLYPEKFKDIDPIQKADTIYSFLVTAKVFNQINTTFRHMAFQPVDLN